METSRSVNTPVEKVLEALRRHGENPKRAKSGYAAHCPAHEDNSPSLSIGIARDGESAIVHCHAGCDPERILDTIGLRMTDLFPPREETNGNGSGRKIVATYDYVDELGQLLYQKVRYDPKDFRQRRPDGNGGWIWKLGDTRQVLYRLPVVEDAASNARHIFFVEGEKDVHAVEAAGAIATTSPLGAGKWRDEFTGMLDGALITVVADRDDAGRNHARMVSEKLGGALILEPASGKDVSDHLAEGLTLDDLVPLSEPEVEVETEANLIPFESWSEFRDSTPEQTEWLVEGILAVGASGFLAAPPKHGKTWIAVALALSVASGKPFLGRFTIPGPRPVMYLALEGSRPALRARFGAVARGLGLDPDSEELNANLHIRYRAPGINLASEVWSKRMVATAQHLGAALIIVDVLRKAAPHLRESGDGATDFAGLVSNLEPLNQAGCAIEFLHHFVKRNESTKGRSLGEMMSGSGALFSHADSLLGVTALEKNKNLISKLTVAMDGRDEALPEPFSISFEGEARGKFGGWEYRDELRIFAVDELNPTAWERAAEVAAWIQNQHRRVSPGQICKEFSIPSQTLRDNRTSLQMLGITYHSEGRFSSYEGIARPHETASVLSDDAYEGI